MSWPPPVPDERGKPPRRLAEPAGLLFGDAGDGHRWLHRADRGPSHPEDCQGACCWTPVVSPLGDPPPWSDAVAEPAWPVTIDTPIGGQWRIRWDQESGSFVAQHRLDGEVTVEIGGHLGAGELAYTFQLERRLGFLLPGEAARQLQLESYRAPSQTSSLRASAPEAPAGHGIGTMERPVAHSVVQLPGQRPTRYGGALAQITLEEHRLPAVELGADDWELEL